MSLTISGNGGHHATHYLPHRRLIGAAALACAAALIPAGAYAATAGSPASQARHARVVTACVTTSIGVVPINTATNKAGKAIKVGSDLGAIAITP